VADIFPIFCLKSSDW